MIIQRITWRDQDYCVGPFDKEDVLDYDTTGVTVGILVAENDEIIALSAEYFAHADNYRHVIRIPKVCIKQREVLFADEQDN